MVQDLRLSSSSPAHDADAPYFITKTPRDTDTSPSDHTMLQSPEATANDPVLVDADADKKQAAAAAPPAAAPAKVNKILFLDGLRGLAAMMVVVEHSKWLPGVHVGQPAVDTFFVLSAFLLTMIFEKKARTLIQERASLKRWSWALLDYFVRRFLRVYPLFMILAIVLACLSDGDRQRYFVFNNPQDYNLFKTLIFSFDYRYHVFWTLPLEIMYYFMIPVFVVITIGLRKFWLLPFLPLSYWIVWSGFKWARFHHQPLRMHLPTFICGSIAAIVYVKAEQFVTKRGIVFKWWHWSIVRSIEYFFLGVYFSVQFSGLFFDWVYHNPVKQTPGEKFVAVNVSIVMVCELLMPGAVASILEWSLLRYAGKISYSMYLLHSFVVYLPYVQNETKYWNKYFATWWLTFLLSTASYHIIEYPCQWLAGRIGKAIKKKDDEEKLRQKQALPVVGEPAVNPQLMA